MMTVTIGAIINIALDPILIFGLGMGVKGAALATILAQAVSAIWVLRFLLGKKSVLKIKKKYLKPDIKIILPILALGVSPFIMQATESLVLVSLNSQLQKYGGDLAVGAMTIMSSIMQIIMLPNLGLTQGAQPIISYNYGAKQMDRVKQTFKLCLGLCFLYTTGMWLALMMLPQIFVGIFNNDPALMEITTWSIKIYFAGIFIFGVQVACQQTFLALGQAKISLILALLRKIILLVPLIFILPMVIENQLFGVLLAEPIADILAATTTIICFMVFYKKTLSVVDANESKDIKNDIIDNN
jgi:Na+-driven multidrug efflux pump